MKKTIKTLLALAAVSVLTACGGKAVQEEKLSKVSYSVLCGRAAAIYNNFYENMSDPTKELNKTIFSFSSQDTTEITEENKPSIKEIYSYNLEVNLDELLIKFTYGDDFKNFVKPSENYEYKTIATLEVVNGDIIEVYQDGKLTMWTVFADKSDIEDYKHDCGITAEQAYAQFFKNFLFEISDGPGDFRGIGILGAITHMEENEFIDSVLQDLPDYECNFSINSSKTRINCKSSGEFSDTSNEQADGFKTFELSYDYDGFYMTEMHGKETSKGRRYNSEDGTFVDGYAMIHTGDMKTTYGSADVEFIDVSKIPYVPSIY